VIFHISVWGMKRKFAGRPIGAWRKRVCAGDGKEKREGGKEKRGRGGGDFLFFLLFSLRGVKFLMAHPDSN